MDVKVTPDEMKAAYEMIEKLFGELPLGWDRELIIKLYDIKVREKTNEIEAAKIAGNNKQLEAAQVDADMRRRADMNRA